MPTVLLAENDLEQAKAYIASLTLAGFQVIPVTNALGIEKVVKEQEIDIIVSDTELDQSHGDEICRKLFEEGKLKDILIIGMSNALDYEKYWISIAHDFLHKRTMPKFYDLGSVVKLLYNLFQKDSKMPRYKENPLKDRFKTFR